MICFPQRTQRKAQRSQRKKLCFLGKNSGICQCQLKWREMFLLPSYLCLKTLWFNQCPLYSESGAWAAGH